MRSDQVSEVASNLGIAKYFAIARSKVRDWDAPDSLLRDAPLVEVVELLSNVEIVTCHLFQRLFFIRRLLNFRDVLLGLFCCLEVEVRVELDSGELFEAFEFKTLAELHEPGVN